VSKELHQTHDFVYHLVQADLWQQSITNNSVYYPPTYEQDGFTHGTANPQKLLQVANHFYKDIPGAWLCLRMTVASLAASGVEVVFEGTAPVGDMPAEFDNSNDELFPHLQGGIHPTAVLGTHSVERTSKGEFLSITGVSN